MNSFFVSNLYGDKNLVLLALKMFGFNPRRISWIQSCLSSFSYSIMLNGSTYGLIIRTRGLRQGDSLSPLLFAIGMKILSRILDKARDLSLIHGFKLSSRGPSISPLLYADDVLLFGRVTLFEARSLQCCLKLFSNWYGQASNPQKSSVFITTNTLRESACAVRGFFAFEDLTPKSKHLGLPLTF